MAGDPSNLILRLRRDIRAKLDDHAQRFPVHDRRFDKIDRRLSEMRGPKDAVLGLATHADDRHETARTAFEALTERVDRHEPREARVQMLEEAV